MSKNPEIELNESEERFLRAFEEITRRTGKEPSLRALAKECADASGARYMRQRLERRGFMRPAVPSSLTELARLALRSRARQR